ncbi:MAG: MoxR family ATPase [Elusimicrobia bacterium]|nr:MoxR family ATPase [Elusimicrobiota bacterium]
MKQEMPRKILALSLTLCLACPAPGSAAGFLSWRGQSASIGEVLTMLGRSKTSEGAAQSALVLEETLTGGPRGSSPDLAIPRIAAATSRELPKFSLLRAKPLEARRTSPRLAHPPLCSVGKGFLRAAYSTPALVFGGLLAMGILALNAAGLLPDLGLGAGAVFAAAGILGASSARELPGEGDDDLKAAHETIQRIRAEVGRAIIGQQELVDSLIMAVVLREHVLAEGVPGVGKTAAIKALAKAVRASFNRIQGTPDLQPADITGSEILQENPDTGRRGMDFRPGPIFAEFVLFDEGNRATPRAQSALLEAMQERQVTAGGRTYPLPLISVLSTQNPIEEKGINPPSEAQIDRFMFWVMVPQPGREELGRIVKLNESPGSLPEVGPVASLEELDKIRGLSERVKVDQALEEYILSLIYAFESKEIKPLLKHYFYTRAAIHIRRAARLQALFQGRGFVLPEDIEAVAHRALRHRMALTYEAAIVHTPDSLIDLALGMVRIP